MIGRERCQFRAACLSEFRDRYQDVLSSAAGIRIRRERRQVFDCLHVFESGFGDGWAALRSVMFPFSEAANRGDVLDFFPEYDTAARVEHYGTPKRWLYSAEALWMMSQATWAWGRQLRSTIESFTSDVGERIARRVEERSGVYTLRPTILHPPN